MKSNLSANKLVSIGQVYQHYKGNQYYVLAIGKHSETLEDLVVYISLYKNSESQVWVRPLEMFIETVEYKGKTLPRFQLVEK